MSGKYPHECPSILLNTVGNLETEVRALKKILASVAVRKPSEDCSDCQGSGVRMDGSNCDCFMWYPKEKAK